MWQKACKISQKSVPLSLIFKINKYFFNKNNVPLNETPNLVTQLNVFKDSSGLLRVKCKLDRKIYSQTKQFPLLIPKNRPSPLEYFQRIIKRIVRVKFYFEIINIPKT